METMMMGQPRLGHTTSKSVAATYLASWPRGSDTHRTMHGALNTVARALGAAPPADGVSYPWHDLCYETAREVPARLADLGLKAPTINKCLVAFRGVLEAAWRAGAMPDEVYRRIQIRNVRGRSLPAGRALDEADLDAVLRAVALAPPRDVALLAVLYGCGLRRIEATRLRREDYDPRAGRIVARGKGGKERSIPVPLEWRGAVDRHQAILAPGAPMFSSRRGRLSRSGVSAIVEAFCRRAGVRRFTPHDLRRTFATRVIDRSDPLIAQGLLGHESLDTTRRYDRRGEAAEVRAVQAIRGPKK